MEFLLFISFTALFAVILFWAIKAAQGVDKRPPSVEAYDEAAADVRKFNEQRLKDSAQRRVEGSEIRPNSSGAQRRNDGADINNPLSPLNPLSPVYMGADYSSGPGETATRCPEPSTRSSSNSCGSSYGGSSSYDSGSSYSSDSGSSSSSSSSCD